MYNIDLWNVPIYVIVYKDHSFIFHDFIEMDLNPSISEI